MQPLLNKVESDKILFEGMPMQKKHLIALTLATILMLFGYNIVSHGLIVIIKGVGGSSL